MPNDNRLDLPNPEGSAEVLKYLGKTLGVNALSGIKGLSTLPQGMDASARAIADYQSRYGPSDNLSPAAIQTVQQYLIPAVNAVKGVASSPAATFAKSMFPSIGMASEYQPAVDKAAEIAGHVSPELGGAVGSAGSIAPYLYNPEIGASEGLLAKYTGEEMPNFAATLPGRAHLNSTPAALEREGEAARRDRQAFTKSVAPTSETDLSSITPSHFSAPDNAVSFLAHDPATGQLIGHVTAAPRGGAMQGIRMDVDPAYRGTGVAPSLLQDAVAHAHAQGMPYHSDTQVSMPAARTYEKLQGVNISRNPAVEHSQDEFDGSVGRSANGQPIYSIHPAVSADDAMEGEPEPNNWIGRQAYAEGGEVSPLLSGISHLAEKYATADPRIAQAVADRIAENGGISYHPVTSTQPTTGYAVATHPGREAILPTAPSGKDVHQYITKNSDAFEKDPGAHFGAWENGGKYYMDVANIDPDIDSAMGKAKQHNQQAIFDIQHGTDIPNPDYQAAQPIAPSDKIRGVAQSYMQQAGLPYSPPTGPVKADPTRGKAIAAAFEAMPHNPDDPDVKASYDKMIQETMAQYQAAKDAGFQAEFIPPGSPDPYKTPHDATRDIQQNNHMWVFPTSSGFGSEPGLVDLYGHPLMQQSGESFNGVPALNNDIFRAVHDYFGHAKEGNGFRANGEESAWANHAAMYSPEARPAMTTETRGQNSWVNFGPHGEANRTASGANTVYAPQKVGLLPPEFTEPQLEFTHYGNVNAPQMTLDPKKMGSGIRGMEARRGGPKVTSLYAADNDAPEPGLESKTKYRVTVPASRLYAADTDPMGLKEGASYNGNLDMSDYEQAIKDAGFAGYHTPGAEGIFRGQARMFEPTQATRISPMTRLYRGESNAGPDQMQSFSDSLAVAQNFASYPGHNKGISYIDIPTENLAQYKNGNGVYSLPPTVSAGKKPLISDSVGSSTVATDYPNFADGGEVEPILGGIGHLVEKYAADVPNIHAAHVADQLAEKGAVTYNPTSGDLHHEGYLVPQPNRSVALDAAPTSNDIHDFMVQNQDAFDKPNAVLHAESTPAGSFLHVALHEPDFEHAMLVAHGEGAPGVRELHTGHNFPLQNAASPAEPEAEQVRNLPEVMGQFDPEANKRQRAPWVHGQQTVAEPQRNAFPGIYDDPRAIVGRANVAPESPLLQRLFGVSREDLSEQALGRQGNELGVLPGASPNPNGSAAARNVMTPQNEQRLIDVLSESRGTPLYTGMTGWYNMDPLYERFRQIYGEDEAASRYSRFNTLMGMASPGSDVGTEIERGTAAHWLNNEGRFSDFMNYAGLPEDERAGTQGFPADMLGVPGHPYHTTAQGRPMQNYLYSGQMQMKSPKVPPYIQSSGVPETGFQTTTPVGDAHWVRGVGLADTRPAPVHYAGSVKTSEMQSLAPWWRDRVAAQAGLDSVPAQALGWGAFAPATGVATQVGAPKLEILAQQIGKLADRLGVSPETARDLVISGKAGAF